MCRYNTHSIIKLSLISQEREDYFDELYCHRTKDLLSLGLLTHPVFYLQFIWKLMGNRIF